MDQLGLQSIAEKARLDPKSGKFVSTGLRSRADREKALPQARPVQRYAKEGGVTAPTARHPDFESMTAKVRGRKGSIGVGMVSRSQDPTSEEMKSDEDEPSALPERGSSGEGEYSEAAAATFEADYGTAAEGAASSSSGQHWEPSVPQPRVMALRPKGSGSAKPMAASPAIKLSPYAHRKVQLAPRQEKKRLRVLKGEDEYEEGELENQDNEEHEQPQPSSPAASTSAESASQLDSQAQEEDAAYIQARVESPEESPELEPQGPVVVIPWQGQADMPVTPRPPQRSKQSKSFPNFRMTPKQVAEHRERQEWENQQRWEDRRRTSQAKAWERSNWWSWHSWAGWQSDQSWEGWQERQQ